MLLNLTDYPTSQKASFSCYYQYYYFKETLRMLGTRYIKNMSPMQLFQLAVSEVSCNILRQLTQMR